MRNMRNIVPIGSLVIGIIFEIVLDQSAPLKTIFTYPITLLGILLIVAGVVQFCFAVSLFVQKETDIRPGGTPTAFIRSGPYRYTRNPIYLANIMVLLGVWIILGSLSPFIVLPIYFLIVNTFIVPFEEKKLVAVFGQEYSKYKTDVRRWI